MGIESLTWQMALIVAVGVFLASFMDAIAGGGGIISIPTYLIAGLPAHMALGTNKVSAGIGTIASTARFVKNGYVDWALALPSVGLALIGSHFGTSLQLMIPEAYLQYLLLMEYLLLHCLSFLHLTMPDSLFLLYFLQRQLLYLRTLYLHCLQMFQCCFRFVNLHLLHCLYILSLCQLLYFLLHQQTLYPLPFHCLLQKLLNLMHHHLLFLMKYPGCLPQL